LPVVPVERLTRVPAGFIFEENKHFVSTLLLHSTLLRMEQIPSSVAQAHKLFLLPL